MKRILSFCMALLMVLSIVTIPAIAEGKVAFTAGTVDAKPGQQVNVPVTFSGSNYEINTLALNVTFDPNALTLNGVTPGDALSDAALADLDDATPGKVSLEALYEERGLKGAGTLFTLNLTVNPGVTSTQTITVNVDEATRTKSSGSTSSVSYTKVNGAVAAKTAAIPAKPTAGKALVIVTVDAQAGDSSKKSIGVLFDKQGTGCDSLTNQWVSSSAESAFESKLPSGLTIGEENSGIALGSTEYIELAPGTYDFIGVSPISGRPSYMIIDGNNASAKADVRRNDYQFEADHTYQINIGANVSSAVGSGYNTMTVEDTTASSGGGSSSGNTVKVTLNVVSTFSGDPGAQLMLDSTHENFNNSWRFYSSSSGAVIDTYNKYDKRIPEGVTTMENVVTPGSSQSIEVPVGTYDIHVVVPDGFGAMNFATQNNLNGWDNYEFTAGHEYTFTVTASKTAAGEDAALTVTDAAPVEPEVELTLNTEEMSIPVDKSDRVYVTSDIPDGATINWEYTGGTGDPSQDVNPSTNYCIVYGKQVGEMTVTASLSTNPSVKKTCQIHIVSADDMGPDKFENWTTISELPYNADCEFDAKNGGDSMMFVPGKTTLYEIETDMSPRFSRVYGYEYTPDFTGQIEISTAAGADGASVDTYLTLLKGDSFELTAWDDKSGDGKNYSKITADVEQGVKYYIVVSQDCTSNMFQVYYNGKFTFKVEKLAAPEPEVELTLAISEATAATGRDFRVYVTSEIPMGDSVVWELDGLTASSYGGPKSDATGTYYNINVDSTGTGTLKAHLANHTNAKAECSVKIVNDSDITLAHYEKWQDLTFDYDTELEFDAKTGEQYRVWRKGTSFRSNYFNANVFGYKFEADFTGDVVFTTSKIDKDIDTYIVVYDGNFTSAYVDFDDNSNGNGFSKLTLPVTSGKTYYVVVCQDTAEAANPYADGVNGKFKFTAEKVVPEPEVELTLAISEATAATGRDFRVYVTSEIPMGDSVVWELDGLTASSYGGPKSDATGTYYNINVDSTGEGTLKAHLANHTNAKAECSVKIVNDSDITLAHYEKWQDLTFNYETELEFDAKTGEQYRVWRKGTSFRSNYFNANVFGYKFEADFTGEVVFTTSKIDKDIDTYIVVYDGNFTSAYVDFDDNSNGNGFSKLTLPVTSGKTYYVVVCQDTAEAANPYADGVNGKFTFKAEKVAPKPAHTITLSCNEITIPQNEYGFYYQIVATVEPADPDITITWSSSDDTYVTRQADSPDNAYWLRGLQVGQAVVTAKTSDGAEASCTVTVDKAVGEYPDIDGAVFESLGSITDGFTKDVVYGPVAENARFLRYHATGNTRYDFNVGFVVGFSFEAVEGATYSFTTQQASGGPADLCDYLTLYSKGMDGVGEAIDGSAYSYIMSAGSTSTAFYGKLTNWVCPKSGTYYLALGTGNAAMNTRARNEGKINITASVKMPEPEVELTLAVTEIKVPSGKDGRVYVTSEIPEGDSVVWELQNLTPNSTAKTDSTGTYYNINVDGTGSGTLKAHLEKHPTVTAECKVTIAAESEFDLRNYTGWKELTFNYEEELEFDAKTAEPARVYRRRSSGSMSTTIYALVYGYKFTADFDGEVVFTTSKIDKNVDTYISVYNSSNCNPYIDCDDASGDGSNFSKLTLNVTSGTTYYVVVSQDATGTTNSNIYADGINGKFTFKAEKVEETPTLGGSASFTITAPSGELAPGEQFDVTVAISGEYGANNGYIEFVFNPDVFELVNPDNETNNYMTEAFKQALTGMAPFASLDEEPGHISYLFGYYEEGPSPLLTFNGDILKVTLRVKDTAQAGSYEFSIYDGTFMTYELGMVSEDVTIDCGTPKSVTVKAAAPVDFTLNYETLTIPCGLSYPVYALIASGVPADATVEWKSSQPAFAVRADEEDYPAQTANECWLDGLAEGETIITATVNGTSKSCTVTVKEYNKYDDVDKLVYADLGAISGSGVSREVNVGMENGATPVYYRRGSVPSKTFSFVNGFSFTGVKDTKYTFTTAKADDGSNIYTYLTLYKKTADGSFAYVTGAGNGWEYFGGKLNEWTCPDDGTYYLVLGVSSANYGQKAYNNGKCVLNVTAQASEIDAGSAEFTVKASKTELNPGDEFDVTVSVTGTYKANTLHIELPFDGNLFEIVAGSGKIDPAFTAAVGTANDEMTPQLVLPQGDSDTTVQLAVICKASADGSYNTFSYTGDVFSFKLKVRDNAADGSKYEFNPTVKEFTFTNGENPEDQHEVETTVKTESVTVTVPVPDEKKLHITAKPSKDTVAKGEEFTVDIMFDGDYSNLYNLIAKISYNKDALTFDAEKSFYSDGFKAAASKLAITTLNDTDKGIDFGIRGYLGSTTAPVNAYKGVVVTLAFKVNADTTATEATFDIPVEYCANGAVRGDDRDIPYTTESGTVKITEGQQTGPTIPTDKAVITLVVPEDLYLTTSTDTFQLLLDKDHDVYGTTDLPKTGWQLPAAAYSKYEYKIPTTVTTNTSTGVGKGQTVSITIDAGTYDVVSVRVSGGSAQFTDGEFAHDDGAFKARTDNFEFKGGTEYTLTYAYASGYGTRHLLSYTERYAPDTTVTEEPSENPSEKPTENPSEKPSENPTENPSQKPDETPEPTGPITLNATEMIVPFEDPSRYAAIFPLIATVAEGEDIEAWSMDTEGVIMFFDMSETLKLIYAQKVGTVNVTVKTKSGASATCKVTVQELEKYPGPDKLSFSAIDPITKVGDEWVKESTGVGRDYGMQITYHRGYDKLLTGNAVKAETEGSPLKFTFATGFSIDVKAGQTYSFSTDKAVGEDAPELYTWLSLYSKDFGEPLAYNCKYTHRPDEDTAGLPFSEFEYTFTEDGTYYLVLAPLSAAYREREQNEGLCSLHVKLLSENGKPGHETTLNEALNVEGGKLDFTSVGDYPWEVFDRDENNKAARSTNVGVNSEGTTEELKSKSVLSTTFNSEYGEALSFYYISLGEEQGDVVCDGLNVTIDGEEVLNVGRVEEWTLFSQYLPAGEHTVVWTYFKDTGASKPGDYAAVDEVKVGAKPQPPVAYDLGFGFETKAEFDQWTAIDADEDTYNWFWNGDAQADQTTPYEGKNCVSSASVYVDPLFNTTTPLEPDNWFISPEFTVGKNGKVSFWYASEDATGNYLGDSMGFYVIEYGQYSNELQRFETKNVGYTNGTFDLSDYEGHVIQIAFRHNNSSDHWIINLDLVQISGEHTDATPVPTETPEPPQTVDPNDAATIILDVGYTYMGGYQLLLDSTHDTFGDVAGKAGFFDFGNMSVADKYSRFEYKLPEGITGNLMSDTSVVEGQATIVVPAGIYDFFVVSPIPAEGGAVLIASYGSFYGGCDDFKFEAGHTYKFSVQPRDEQQIPDDAFYFYDNDELVPATNYPDIENGWSFENDPFAEAIGWTTLNKDSDARNWTWAPGSTYLGYLMPAYEGTGLMYSESSDVVNEVDIDVDNWLISPLFPAGREVSFYLASYDTDETCTETVSIYVSIDGGETWGDPLETFRITSSEYDKYTVDTSEFIGRNIQIAFRHHDSAGNWVLMLDMVQYAPADANTPEPTTEVPVTDTPETPVPPTEAPVTDVPVTDVPGDNPTEVPGDNPTEVPGDNPTEGPGENPTEVPGDNPTQVPGENPTQAPGGDKPNTPPTGAISLVGLGVAAVLAGSGVVLFRKKREDD